MKQYNIFKYEQPEEWMSLTEVFIRAKPITDDPQGWRELRDALTVDFPSCQ